MTQQPIPMIIEEPVVPKKIPETIVPKKAQFQPKVAKTATSLEKKPLIQNVEHKSNSNSVDLKTIIEKKRQEALIKLRRRQIQSK